MDNIQIMGIKIGGKSEKNGEFERNGKKNLLTVQKNLAIMLIMFSAEQMFTP
jgi:hypothetical protein